MNEKKSEATLSIPEINKILDENYNPNALFELIKDTETGEIMFGLVKLLKKYNLMKANSYIEFVEKRRKYI